MRRFLSSAGWYLAGLLTLPLLYVGTRVMIATAADHRDAVVSRDTEFSEPLAAEADEAEAEPAIPSATIVPAPTFHEEKERDASLIIESDATPSDFAQADRDQRINAAVEDDPFSSDPTIRLGLDAPPSPPQAPAIVLPVTTESLAADAGLDEAGLSKVKELRETLKQVVEEKAAKLSAAALEAEIQMHQRHLLDLNALQELLTLASRLKELSDKFPNSESGRQAHEMLKLLERLRHAPAGTKVDIDIIQPRQTKFAPKRDAFDPSQNPSNYREQPIQRQKAPEFR